jgi:hypothetical protein
MMTLKAKLSGIDDDDKLVSRVVEVWGFFFDQVLPYIEGVSQFTYYVFSRIISEEKMHRFCFRYTQIRYFLLCIALPRPADLPT